MTTEDPPDTEIRDPHRLLQHLRSELAREVAAHAKTKTELTALREAFAAMLEAERGRERGRL